MFYRFLRINISSKIINRFHVRYLFRNYKLYDLCNVYLVLKQSLVFFFHLKGWQSKILYQFSLHHPLNFLVGINSLQPKICSILVGDWVLWSVLLASHPHQGSSVPYFRCLYTFFSFEMWKEAVLIASPPHQGSSVQNFHPPHPSKTICICFKFTRVVILLSITFPHPQFRASLLKMLPCTAPVYRFVIAPAPLVNQMYKLVFCLFIWTLMYNVNFDIFNEYSVHILYKLCDDW